MLRVVPRAQRGRQALVSAGVQWLPPGPPSNDAALEAYAAGPDRDYEGVYGPRAKHSYFADLLAVDDARARSEKALESAVLRGRDQGAIPSPGRRGPEDTLDAVKRRLDFASSMSLDLAQFEKRDLTSTTANAFIPKGVPSFVGSAFATSARAQATLLAALPHRPLPEDGEDVKVPLLSAGASVAIQDPEGDPVSETDPQTALATSHIAMLSGQVDVSRQLLERARPAVTNVSGRVAVSYTDSSPTQAELLSKLMEAYRLLATPTGGYGIASPKSYLLALHPRRLGWLALNADVIRVLEDMFTLVPCASISTTKGAGTNEDEAFLIARDESFVAVEPPTVAVYGGVSESASLVVRVQARQSVAAMFSRAPNSLAHLSGTGFSAVVL